MDARKIGRTYFRFGIARLAVNGVGQLVSPDQFGSLDGRTAPDREARNNVYRTDVLTTSETPEEPTTDRLWLDDQEDN